MLNDIALARYMALFSGYQGAYGTYEITGVDPAGKHKGKALTHTGAPTSVNFRAHLDGTGPGLGVILLCEDDTVNFGAIDYDVKNMDHKKAEARVASLGLPLVLCRSKSGGGHFYCFTQAPVPATIMREKLEEWRALLAMPAATEIFPKQVSRYSPEDIGGWINLPYYRAEETDRWAIHMGGHLPLEGFLELAESRRVTLAELTSVAIMAAPDSLFAEGPPCLILLEQQGGFQEGTRNMGMTAVLTYLKKRYPDNWKIHVDAYNERMAKLGSAELQEIIKHYSRPQKNYNYQCKQAPINSVCQRRRCTGQMYGVGEGALGDDAQTVEITAVIKYLSPGDNEPMWSMDINGKRVMVANSQFYSKDEFNKACMAQVSELPVHAPPARWAKRVQQLITGADVIQLPADASGRGQFWEWVENFMTDQTTASSKEGVLNGIPYREGEYIWFRSQDIFRYLDSHRVKYKNESWVFVQLRERGCETEFWHLKGNRGVNVWKVKAPAQASPTANTNPLQVAPKEEF